MLIARYEQWRENEAKRLKEENPLIDCVECNGGGAMYSDCRCCGAEKEELCDVCMGDGKLRYLDSPIPRPGRDLVGPDNYFRAVIADLKKWGVWTGDSFLDTAGSFVKEFRSQYGEVTWKRQ